MDMILLCKLRSWLIILGIFMPMAAGAMSLSDYAENPIGPILFVRHALAPGTGDPGNFTIGDCSTQRNLDAQGRAQALALGEQLRRSGLVIAGIMTSQWCRCAETAELLGLGPVLPEPGLNSFYQNFSEREPTLEQLRARLADIGTAYNPVRPEITVMVTHFVTINAVAGLSVTSGGMAGFNPVTGDAVQIDGN